MHRKIFPIILVLTVTILFSSYKIAPSFILQQRDPLKTIIIDAGHGLPDTGAQGSYSNESDITLAIALKLGKQLQAVLPDSKIIYTRTDAYLPNGMTDHNAANRWRAEMANENHGDLFICIHCNDAPPERHTEFTGYHTIVYHRHGKKYTRRVREYKHWTTPNPAYGTETYVWAVGKNDSKKSFVGSSDEDSTELYGEQADSSYHYFDSPEAKILASLKTKKYFARSLMLADYVEDEFTKEGRLSRGVKQRDNEGIWVLQATAMPSILVETGFITNPQEENYLNSEKGQNEISYAIMRAVLHYKASIDNNSIETTPGQ